MGSQRCVKCEQNVMERAQCYKGYEGEYLEIWIGIKNTALSLKSSTKTGTTLCFLTTFTPNKIPCSLPALDSNACVYRDIVKINKCIFVKNDRGEWLLCEEPKRSCSIDNNLV